MVFLGTPEVAVPPLRGLVEAGFDVALVVSGADRRRGRGAATSPSPVKAAALELGLPVTSRVDDVLEAGADLGVVVAYGRLVRPHVLAEVPMVNVHFSLLPRWRGAAPVERALLAGDEQTGVCLMQLEEGLDTGPVYGCERVPIEPEETLDELRGRLVGVGTGLLLRSLEEGLGQATPQEGEVTYAGKLEPAELHLEWTRPAPELHRVVRLGRAWTTFRDARLLVLRARVVDGAGSPGELAGSVVVAGEGALELLEVQPEGRRPMPAAAWLAGVRPRPGERLG